MDERRFFVILNPTAGQGAARRAEAEVRAVLGDRAEITRTRGRGHAAELAERAARDGWPAVVAVGGDGTVHEAANGLMRAVDAGADAALGIVPAGSGNDFARLAGVPPRAGDALRRLRDAVPRAVDVGRVGDLWFTNGVGVGLDARVAVEANRNRRLRGIGIYLWALARTLRSFRPPTMRIEVDGDLWIEQPMTLVTVGNGARHGGGFWICPDARIDDGVLDVCACDALGTMGILRTLPLTLRGWHMGQSCVRMRQVRSIRISSPDPLPVHADGEIVAEDAHDLRIEIHPGRMRILA